MIDVERQHFRKELMRFLYITQSAITQSHYIATVNAIALVEIIVPNGQIGQRNSKVVYATMVEEVFLAMLDELIELGIIASVRLNSDYNYTDTTTKQYRYQAVFDIVHY